MKVEKEVLIFRSEKELRDYVNILTAPASQVTVDGSAYAKYPITVDITHTYGKYEDAHHIVFREPRCRIINWFKQSNRWKHLLYGFLVSIIAGFAFTLGCAAGMEFKDKQAGGKWDWIDFGLTVAGAWFGLMLRIVIINALGIEWLKLWI
ncbi:hypothetical protein BT528P2_00024 [Bacteroides phage BT528P2]|nr:hypothetical protein BT498P1_00029 [Bacteroides phage BT498P1]WAX09315.1 hypothetical protein BT528P1_00024 [Bacteroides phage BT528P1]WAX09361.1 hypothetical protein BT528P2_00024 [Bacteroides phage BT528P2]